jgi:hypothetical protein
VERLADRVVEGREARRVRSGVEHNPSRVDRNSAALRVDDPRKRIPGTEGGDAPGVSFLPVQPFQDGHVLVVLLVV